jgi:MFS family permease
MVPVNAPSGSTGTHAGTLAVLRQPLYAQLLGANFVTSMGVWLYVAAAAWVMLELTGSPFMVGLVSGGTFLPRLLLGVPAGALIDVFDRRYMIIVGNLFQAGISVTAGVLHATGSLGPWTLILMTLGIGAGQALSMPAYHSTIQDVVPRADVAAAVTLHSGSVNVARAVGPAVGGGFIATGHTELAFVFTGISYLALCLTALRIPKPRDLGSGSEPMVSAMRTGVRFMRHSPLLLRLVATSALFVLGSANIQALLAPAAADRGLGAQGYGLLFSCFGLGALVGALVTRRLGQALGRHLQPVSISAFGVAGVAFAYVPGAPLAAVAIALAGAAWVVTFATLNTMVQLTAPTWVRGRVLSLYMMAFTGAMPVGAALAGTLADVTATAPAIAVMSVAVVAVAGVARLLRLPSIRDIDAARAPEDWPDVAHVRNVRGGPVAVLVTWSVPVENVPPFLEAMKAVRRSRLRSGAYRWLLCHDPERPERLTELFEVPDWDEHLRQHGRLDHDAITALRRAHALSGGEQRPQVRHLVGLPAGAESAAELWTSAEPALTDRVDGRAP